MQPTDISAEPEDTSIDKICVVNDIYISAYLAALGYTLVRCYSDGYKTSFHYQDVPTRIILNYFNGVEHFFSARKLFDAFNNSRRISREVRLINGTDQE